MTTIASLLLIARLTTDYMTVPQPPKEPVRAVETLQPGGDGTLTVSASATPRVGSVPQGASRVPMLQVDLSASCEADIAVSELAVRHAGLGDPGDISGVYVLEQGRRISRSATFDGDGVARLRLRQLQVPKCESVSLQIVGDLSRTAAPAGEHGAELRMSYDVVSTAARTELTTGNQLTISTSPTAAGAVSVKFLSVNPRLIRYGRIETVARLQLTADGSSDQLLRSITLTNNESARDFDLINLSLQTSSQKVLSSTASRLNGKQVTLTFEPSYVLKRGQTVVLLLKAEVRGSVTRKVQFMLEEESDLDASVYRSRN